LSIGLKGNTDGSGAVQIGGSDAITISTGLNTTFAGTVTASGTVAGSTGTLYPLTSGTAVASASGTAIDFTGIPSWVKRITVMFSGVSTSGSSTVSVQLGDSGGIENTGYAAGGVTSVGGTNNVGATSTSRFLTQGGGGASDISHGLATIALISTNAWVFSFIGAHSQAGNSLQGGGSKTLSDTLTQVRITTVNGTDTFDAGSINILYE
jgi:hypothetical protein